jgi:hypothetical protein
MCLFAYGSIVLLLALPMTTETLPDSEVVTNRGSHEKYLELTAWLMQSPDRHCPVTPTTIGDTTIWMDSHDQEVVRDVAKERSQIKRYLDDEAHRCPSYIAYLSELQSQPTMRPMSDKCRVSVFLPAWMEGKIIYNTLSLYEPQIAPGGIELDPDLWEMNILVNRKTGDPSDKSVDEIRRFVCDSASRRRALGKSPIHVNFVDVEFDPPGNNVGNARKVATDLILLRSLARATQAGPLYLESEDADLEEVSPLLIYNVLTTMDENPHLDAVTGTQDRYPRELMQNDYLFLRTRIYTFRRLLLSRKEFRDPDDLNFDFRWNREITEGWNSAHSAEALALIGGCNPLSATGEDLELGEKYSMVRGVNGKPNLDVIGRVPTRCSSSTRRCLASIILDKNAYLGGEFTNPYTNLMIRELSIEELLDRATAVARITPENTDVFDKLVSEEISWGVGKVPVYKQSNFISRIMLFLGFDTGDYVINADKTVTVANWENVKTKLTEYRGKHAYTRAL